MDKNKPSTAAVGQILNAFSSGQTGRDEPAPLPLIVGDSKAVLGSYPQHAKAK
jgi:hypothetical protein